MTVYVVATEFNRGHDLEGAYTLHGVFATREAAERAHADAIAEYRGFGMAAYPDDSEVDWDFDTAIHDEQVRS